MALFFCYPFRKISKRLERKISLIAKKDYPARAVAAIIAACTFRAASTA